MRSGSVRIFKGIAQGWIRGWGRPRTRLGRVLRIALVALVAGSLLITTQARSAKADPCGAGGNPVACENSKTGSPASAWDVGAGEGTTIQGFADPFSVNLGGTVNLKIESPAKSYTIDIYRMGYYGGDGARLITSITPNISVSQHQPSCATNTATGLIDCSNWGVSASWTVPTNMVSGVYFAHVVRTDGTSDENQIPFVVRSDSSHSGILFETDDETWQAYNSWGGNSLYTGTATDTLNRYTSLDGGRAEQVSYDRPFNTRFNTPSGQDFFFYGEFPMIEFLEENGYDVSYIDQGTVAGASGASLIEQHKILLKSGHDEYWTASEVANVTAARNAGVNLAFFTGNEVYWKTRFASDAAGESNRTLITYKESLDSAQTDPTDPPTWTGAWWDPRFSPPADGGRPQNALTGQVWTVNDGTSALTVPYQDSALRFWRNTSVANLQSGQTATLTSETLGYEWDQDLDNGFRPAGEFDLSSTTITAPEVVTDYQEDLAQETLTHHLTLYRAASGALVFEAGTVQWAWGLNSNHDGDQPAVNTAMQQATVNLLADMGNVQPTTLMLGLVAATQSSDSTPPSSSITSPSAGASLANGSTVTISGTATDSGGGVVAGVEVSTDGGGTWHPVTTMSRAAGSVTWSYTWSATGSGPTKIESRATDDSGNIETPSDATTVSLGCPCSLYGQSYTPSVTSEADSSAVEVGVKFTSTVNGWVAGVRFYKGSGNTGTHTGSLWTSTGTLLATGTFTNETSSGWQTLQFANPVAVNANTVYVAGYYAPNGHYSYDSQQFYPGPTGSPYLPPLGSTPVSAVRATASTVNGVYNAGGPGFPTATFGDSGYGVDVIFDTSQPPGLPPSITAAQPASGATSVATGRDMSVVFNQQVETGSPVITVTDPSGNSVQGTTSLDSTGTTLTFTPSSPLSASTTYTLNVSGATSISGAVMTPVSWQFKTAGTASCPCTLFDSNAVPGNPDADDSTPVTVGVQFSSDTNGWITGVRFYKGSANTGTHVGSLWTSTGQLLAQGTFSNESASGWQTLTFANPIAVTAGTTYVAGYYAPNGNYAADTGYFSANVDNSPLHAAAAGNGVYALGGNSFPNHTFSSTNYWVDPIFASAPPSTSSAPQVSVTSPIQGDTTVRTNSSVSFTFNQAVQGNSITFKLTAANGTQVAGTTSYNSSTGTGTFTPSSALATGVTYTATVSAATGTNGVAMASPYSWTFSTGNVTIWPPSATPATASASDPNAVNVGVKFTAAVNGSITGIRFYKGSANTGTHVGSLWDSSGNLLGQVTFSNETASGWQQANFATPIPITAGTVYIASYFAPNGNYSVTSGGLANQVNNPPLASLASGTSGPNGVYSYGSQPAFPQLSYNSSNYWVDVAFAPVSS